MAPRTLPPPTAASAPARPVACGRRGAARPAAVLAWFALVVLASLLLVQELPVPRSGTAAVASATAVDVSGALPQLRAVAALPAAGRAVPAPAVAFESSVALLAAAALCLTLVRRPGRPRSRMPCTRRLRVPAADPSDAALGRHPLFAARAADTNNAMLAPTDGVRTSRCPRSRPACRP